MRPSFLGFSRTPSTRSELRMTSRPQSICKPVRKTFEPRHTQLK